MSIRPDAVTRTTSGNRDGLADDLAVALDVCFEVDSRDGGVTHDQMEGKE